jgi:hypothetical protein
MQTVNKVKDKQQEMLKSLEKLKHFLEDIKENL